MNPLDPSQQVRSGMHFWAKSPILGLKACLIDLGKGLKIGWQILTAAVIVWELNSESCSDLIFVASPW